MQAEYQQIVWNLFENPNNFVRGWTTTAGQEKTRNARYCQNQSFLMGALGSLLGSTELFSGGHELWRLCLRALPWYCKTQV